MTDPDADWPSLPPIRTSSHNSRVSCETLNLPTAPPNPAPDAADHARKPSSAAASPPASSSHHASRSSSLCSCFPRRSGKRPSHDSGKKSTFGTAALLRSMFGPVAPRYAAPKSTYASGVSPPNRALVSSLSTSPSGHVKMPGGATSPINLMRSGGSNQHSTAVLRTSKGHTGHSFTMMPPDVVGKKKPPDYESDEPTSPEVTCIGKVRRKHCKATWDALVKEKNKSGKGKVKRLSGEMPRMSGEILRKPRDERKPDIGELSFSAKLSNQRSRRSQSHDLDSFAAEPDRFAHKPTGDVGNNFELGSHIWKQDGYTRNDDTPVCGVDDREAKSFLHSKPESEGRVSNSHQSSQIDPHDNEEPVLSNDSGSTAPPSNCLLMMKNRSRNRSSHYAGHSELLGKQDREEHQWNWGQVLT